MAFNKAKALQEAEKLAAQGKLSQAIKQYLVIIENDPGDLPLLNTVSDLCVRDRDIPEALRLLRRLADAYAREGFVLKAIAIYRKITKLQPEAIEPLLKLAELYTAQGLGREALKLYAEALESAKTRGPSGQVLDIVRRIVAADPQNEAHRLRLAECCEAAGHRAEAARAYLDLAEAAAGRGDGDSASSLRAKAAELDPTLPGITPFETDLAPAQEVSAPAPPPNFEPVTAPPIERVPETLPALEPQELGEIGIPAEDSSPAAEAQITELKVPEAPVELLPTGGVAPAALAREFDLSSEWEALAASTELPGEAIEPVPSIEADSLAEIEFYLDAGLIEEARRSIDELETRVPGHPQVADLRRRLVDATPTEPAVANHVPPPSVPDPLTASPSPAVVGDHLLQDLAADFESHWTGLDQPAPPLNPPQALAPQTTQAAKDFRASLGALLDELGEETQHEAPEDPETQYSLGVAFREMGLLEEAIGEFQKVVKTAGPGSAGLQSLQACTLLGVCFMDKRMPTLAAKWYRRALDSPGLGEDTRLALEYDLGMAYEQAGDSKAALERFLEVYSQNIDYRDVAEKIRQLQQRPS